MSFYTDNLFVCSCHLPDHCFIIREWRWSDDDVPELTFSVGLTTYRNIFKRFWAAIKYIFKPIQSHHLYDEVLLKEEDIGKLIDILQKYEKEVKLFKENPKTNLEK